MLEFERIISIKTYGGTKNMKERSKKIKQMRVLPVFLLAVIIILQLLNITNTIVNKKKGYHSDEIYSYGLSNSFYQPFIHSNSVYGEEYLKVNEWFSGEVLREYVTVQPDERFRYDSVWYNQTQDRHPPLYYAVLHTICSFFPNTYSPVFGYIINYVCFIVMQIFLYKLAVNMLKSKYLALLLCCLWGFSAGAVDLTIFIRMYCMLAMMTVIFMYLHSEMYRISRQPGQKPSIKMYIALITVTALGALTQHMFLIVAFLTAVFFCIYYLVKKQFKIFLKYGFSMLGGAVLSVLIFPSTIPHLLSESSNVESLSFLQQLFLTYRYSLRDIAISVIGGNIVFLCMTVPVFLLIAAAFLIPILYLLRDKPEVKKILSKLKSLPKKFKIRKLKKALKNLWCDIKKIHPLFYLFLICITVIFATTAYSINFIAKGYVNRYLFIVYPLAELILVYLICFLFRKLKCRRTVVTIIFLAIIIYNISGNTVTFLFDDTRTMDSIDELTAGNECIFVEKTKAETWLVETLPGSVYNADKVFMTYVSEDESITEELASLKTNKKVYLFINESAKTDVDGTDYFLCYDNQKDVRKIPADDYYDIFRNLPYSTMLEYVGKYTIFARTYTIYELA